MSNCKQCGGPNPSSTGYKQRETCSDKCRRAYSREKAATAARTPRRTRVDALAIEPGDESLVDRVSALVAEHLDAEHDEVAAAQGSLAVQLARLAADGSVSACRELRLLLLEMRVASDPAYEGEASQALCLELLLTHIEGAGGVTGIEPAGQPWPPGWHSTAQDGEVLEWIGHRWMELREAGDVQGLADLERWIGNHSPEIFCLRSTGRWSVWPDRRDSL